ncbi:MAG: hypothetical protein R3E32_00330 [Chitinophagales bacterium]
MIKEKSNKLYEKAVDIIRKKGFINIKANAEDLELESPTAYVQQNKDDVYTPDLTALHLGRKSYFEIALKTTEVRRLVNKWKLMSKLAEVRHGGFFLLVPRGHARFTSQLVEDYNIQADLIKL